MKDHILGSMLNSVVALKRQHTYLWTALQQRCLNPGRWPVAKQFESEKPITTLITERCAANALAG